MAEIPEDIKKGLKGLADSSKTDIKTLVAELKDIVENDATASTMEQVEFRIRYAYALLLNRYTSTGGTKQMYIKPLSKPRARRVTIKGVEKYVGGLYALVRLVEKDNEGNVIKGDIKYGAGTLWENAAENAMAISPDKVYKTALKVTEGKLGYELGANDASFVEVDEKFPNNEEYYEKEIKPIEDGLMVRLADLDLNNREDQTDIKVIRAMVLDNGTGETANKVEFGRYTIADDSMIGREEGGPANFAVWVHPDEIIWDNGSTLKFVGSVNFDEKAGISRFDCHFVIPTEVALRKKLEIKPVGKEDVSVEDLDKELDGEHQKVQEKIEDDFSF